LKTALGVNAIFTRRSATPDAAECAARPQMEMIGAIENMNLTLQIPNDSIAAEMTRVDRPNPVPTLYLE
jgi:hypothetical protein